MKSIIIISLSVIALIITGCARTYNLSNQDTERENQMQRLSEFSESNNVTIVFIDNRTLTARHLRFTPDSLTFTSITTKTDMAVATDRLSRIIILDKKQGARDGAGILGFCTGMLGIAGAFRSLPGGAGQEDNRTLNIILIYCVSSIPGMAAGYGLGSLIGSRKNYLFYHAASAAQ